MDVDVLLVFVITVKTKTVLEHGRERRERRERREKREEREKREKRERRENAMSPVDVDRIAILGHIRTSGIVVTRDVALRSTRYTEGPDRSSLTLSIVRLVRTECIRNRHGKCLRKVLCNKLAVSLVQKRVWYLSREM
jgi:hypothetical protein